MTPRKMGFPQQEWSAVNEFEEKLQDVVESAGPMQDFIETFQDEPEQQPEEEVQMELNQEPYYEEE